MSELIRALLAGVGGMLGWGVADVGTAKGLDDGMTEAQIGALFYIITAIILWGVYIFQTRAWPVITIKLFAVLFVFAQVNYIAYKLFFKSLSLPDSSVGVMSAVFSSYGIFTVPVSVFIFAEIGTPIRWALLLIIPFAIAIVSIPNLRKINVESGTVYAFAAAVLFGFMFPFWDATLSIGDEILIVAIVDTLIAVIFAVDIYMMEREEFDNIAFNKGLFIILLFAGGANAFAVISTTWGFATTSLTSVVVVVSSAVPMVSAIIGHLMLRGKHLLSQSQWIGVAMIVIASAALALT